MKLARSFLALGERLKFTEQKLNYLKRCKSYNVYPVFILNGVKVILNLFGGRKSRYIYNLGDKLRSSSLRYHARNSYDEIRNIKRQLHNTKQHLYLNISDQFLIHEILRTVEDYNFYIRTHHKCRLQKKFNWLLYKYYNIASNFHDRIQPLSSTAKPEDLVTVLNLEEHPVELTQKEINVLSLVPRFAVTPKK